MRHALPTCDKGWGPAFFVLFRACCAHVVGGLKPVNIINTRCEEVATFRVQKDILSARGLMKAAAFFVASPFLSSLASLKLYSVTQERKQIL